MITTFLTTPNAGDGRSAFVAAANAFGDGLTPLSNEMNQTAADVNSDAMAAALSASQANTAKNEAIDARDAAIAAMALSASEYDAGSHVYAKNDMAWSLSVLYLCVLGYTSGATLPKDDPTHWVPMLTSLSSFTALQATVDTLRNVPVSAPAGAYTATDADRGRNLQLAGTLTLPTGLTIGTVLVATNLGASAVSIAPGSGATLRLAGTTKSGTLSLAGYSKATLSLETSTLWMAAGAGLT